METVGNVEEERYKDRWVVFLFRKGLFLFIHNSPGTKCSPPLVGFLAEALQKYVD